MLHKVPNTLLATGLAAGLDNLTNLEFDIHSPYTGCCICGALYQTNLDRQGIAPYEAERLRKQWATTHSKTHTAAQHAQLKLSGYSLTPQAAHRLAAFGIVDLVGLTQDDEIKDAYATAGNVPENDADGT